MLLFDNIINIKNLDPNKIKLDETSYKNILIYNMAYVIVKVLSYKAIISVHSLYLYINKINGYIEENYENKYLTLVRTDESKDTSKKYEELWNKIRYLIRTITNISDDYDEEQMKIKFNIDDNLPLNKS